MPQGRRKIPFSSKAKKAQLSSKREKKRDGNEGEEDVSRRSESREGAREERTQEAENPCGFVEKGRRRYELKFKDETPRELEAGKKRGYEILSNESMEVSWDEMFPPEGLDFPERPKWKESMSKKELETREDHIFSNYVESLMKKWGEESLSYFELNLETWRQLWRVTEMSDVLLLILDVRFVPAMIPPFLFQTLRQKGKDLIIVLNKVDLVPPPLVLAWRDSIKNRFPGVYVTLFTSCPSYNLVSKLSLNFTGLKFRRLKGNISMVAEGARQIFEVCREIVEGSNVNLESWEKEISGSSYASRKITPKEVIHAKTPSKERFVDNVLTIGVIGQPNAGKSSLINSLLGKKSVSVSRTPGHTKHFQTMFITDSVKLCDCPGLVFPSLVPKSLQVIMGSFPIARVREPYGAIRYIGERVDLPEILGIIQYQEEPWTPVGICEAWAHKRSYMSAKSNRPDIYRSANHILRMTLAGAIPLWLTPPGYDAKEWQEEEALNEIYDLTAAECKTENPPSQEPTDHQFLTDSSSEDEGVLETRNMFTALTAD